MQIKKWNPDFDIEEYEPTNEEAEIGKLLSEMGGNISAVSRARNQERRSIYRRIEDSEYLQAIVDEAREVRLDTAERQLHEAVDRGEAWAVCFTLKTLGKSRGYTEKSELDITAKPMTLADLVTKVAKEEEERMRIERENLFQLDTEY